MKTISSLLEMAKRASPDSFYKFGKDMYGAEKVKSLSWSEVKAIADKHDVLIPAYLRSQKVGRGRFNIIPADHADAKEPVKSAPLKKPEAPRDAARKNDEVTDEVLKSALMFVKNKMLSHSSSYSMTHPIEETDFRGKKAFAFELRDWGQWVVPDDVEDDGDYDWEVLTDKYRKILKDIRDEARHEYPAIDFDFDIGEKNWITVTSAPKAKVAEAKMSRGEREAQAEVDAFKEFVQDIDMHDIRMVVGNTDPEMGERGIKQAADRLKTHAPRIYAAVQKAFK